VPLERGPELEALARELGFAYKSAVEIEQRFVELTLWSLFGWRQNVSRLDRQY